LTCSILFAVYILNAKSIDLSMIQKKMRKLKWDILLEKDWE